MSGKTRRVATSAAPNRRSRQNNGEERTRRSDHNGRSHASGNEEGGRNDDQGRNGSVSEGGEGNADSTRISPAIEIRAAAVVAAATEPLSPSPPPIGANGFVTAQPHLLSEPSGTLLLTSAAADAAVVVPAETPLRTKDQNPISSRSLASLRGEGSARPSRNRGDPGGRRQENGCDKNGTVDVVKRSPAAAPLGWSLAAIAMRFLNGDANDRAADGTSNSDSGYSSPQVNPPGDKHVLAVTFASSDGERSSPDNNSTDEGVGSGVDLEVEGLRRQLAELASAADSAAVRDEEGRVTVRDVLEEATARAEEAGRAERARSETLNQLVQVHIRALNDHPYARFCFRGFSTKKAQAERFSEFSSSETKRGEILENFFVFFHELALRATAPPCTNGIERARPKRNLGDKSDANHKVARKFDPAGASTIDSGAQSLAQLDVYSSWGMRKTPDLQ